MYYASQLKPLFKYLVHNIVQIIIYFMNLENRNSVTKII